MGIEERGEHGHALGVDDLSALQDVGAGRGQLSDLAVANHDVVSCVDALARIQHPHAAQDQDALGLP